ncbi:hypothetical protein HOA92_04230 [archaeon]|nr:hypothetical protein [archaeon]MBT6762222.1 hypothetical protein [archaeon]
MVQEANIKLDIKIPKDPVSKAMGTFYNPKMLSHRNITINAIKSFTQIKNKPIKIGLPLAGSGIRALRILNEISTENISEIAVNDIRENFIEDFQKSIKTNKLNSKKVSTHNQDANLFLLNNLGFDYIDLDPFGSPNQFLAAVVARINRKGIIAITATDTAALAGTYPKACKRKYWASPLKNHLMHELGLRILIRKVQLQGVQFGKALTPILSYHKDHYYRIFFQSSSGKEKCNNIQTQHQYFLYNPKTLESKISKINYWEAKSNKEFQVAGPLWTGPLHDKTFIKTIIKKNDFNSEVKLLRSLQTEAENPNIIGFIDSHILAKKYKIKVPTNELLLNIKGTWRTQFSETAIKTKLQPVELIKKLKT